ncbi:FAD:protein FMN transferase [Kordiimonas aestuarii]|uniref:FAD:protein FMN transferase n=1 Tax=Kordiimonas aestuarii TaxID=1005925 RepID=UPI0021D15C94|nr:FAD:protein FMN transferase [Kordiimonas aestuarii]
MSCCHKVTRAKPLMGDVLSLSTLGIHGACAMRALRVAFTQVEQLEASVDTDYAESELMRLCASPPGTPVATSKPLWYMLRLAQEVAYRSDGVFDVASTGTGGAASWLDIDLSVAGFVTLRRPLMIDLGGIKKGFAVDLAVQTLRDAGVRRGIVDLGGHIRAFGAQEWRVHFHLEAETAKPGLPVMLNDGAISGFGGTLGGGAFFDTSTHMVRDSGEWGDMSMIVRAPTAAAADALTVVAALMPSKAARVLSAFGANGIVLTRQGAHALEYAS